MTDYVFGDWTIRYTDGSHEDVGGVRLWTEAGFLRIGYDRMVPADRVREIVEWDRHGFKRSYDMIMSLPEEQRDHVIAQLETAPIKMVEDVPSDG